MEESGRMREYLFYVLLVFLPIGFLMVKILKNYGLPPKNIIYIVLISLIIIISFPVCMARLGLILTFSLYAIFLLLIIFYIVKMDEIAFDETNNPIMLSNLEITEPNLDLNQTETVIIENQQEMEIESLINNIAEDINDIAEDNSITDYTEEIIKETTEVISKETEKTPIKELLEELIDNATEEKLEVSKEDISEDFAEVTKELELIKEIKEEDEADEIDNNILAEVTDKDDLDVHDNKIDKIIIENESEQDIISYIEKGFQYKIGEDFPQSLAHFLFVWEHTKDFDLKFLVTIELAELYMLEGLYNKAQDLLTIFQTEIPSTKFNEALEIKKRLDYITLINKEITRLGLEVVPLAKLPRWVKIKVAEELNQVV